MYKKTSPMARANIKKINFPFFYSNRYFKRDFFTFFIHQRLIFSILTLKNMNISHIHNFCSYVEKNTSCGACTCFFNCLDFFFTRIEISNVSFFYFFLFIDLFFNSDCEQSYELSTAHFFACAKKK